MKQNRITFSHNWNNKLDCRAFTTLRLSQPTTYRVGEVYEIFLKEGKEWQQKDHARIHEIKRIRTSQINDYIGYLDTGYDAEQTKKIISRMYPQLEDPLLDFILLVKTNPI